VHELATGAAKHGALPVPSGRVAITWVIKPWMLRKFNEGRFWQIALIKSTISAFCPVGIPYSGPELVGYRY
jgi:hypothetical protein